MITKLSTFRGVADSGEPLVKVFHQGDSIHKTAGQLLPEIQDWLSTYKSDKENIAVLVNALGAAEYWGQNSNGDRFSWAALSHDCRRHAGHQHPIDDFTEKVIPPYGYWTFKEFAKVYAHHKNKDPNRAFGEVVVSALNAKMKRVELVVLINRKKALEFGAQHVVDRIDNGEFADVSMGTRVPYDVCCTCGHKSKTRNDYCACLRSFPMGAILPDGRQIGVWNPHPRFFDISFVFIGADKTAKMMMKLGSGIHVPTSVIDAEIVYGIDRNDEDLLKSASYCSMQCGTCSMSSSCEKPGRLMELNGKTKEAKVTGMLRTLKSGRALSKNALNKANSISEGLAQFSKTQIPRGSKGRGRRLFTTMSKTSEELPAEMQKSAMDLEDYFLGGKDYVRRERMWKNKETGESSYHIGSGLGDRPSNMTKTAESKKYNLPQLVSKFGNLEDPAVADMMRKLKAKGLDKAASVEALKFAAQKLADQRKWAEIIKEIDPAGNDGRVMAVLNEREPTIDKDTLNEMGENGVDKALTTPSMMGMVLKPEEFQRVLLSAIGKTGLADELDAKGVTFNPEDGEEEEASQPLEPEQFSPRLMRSLLPFLEDRSYLEPVVKRRIIRITIVAPQPDTVKEASSPLLTKMASAYNWYRKEAVKIALASAEAINRYPELNAAVQGVSEEDLLSEKIAMSASSAIAIGSVPATLMWSADARKRYLRGEPVGEVSKIVANHPLLSSLGIAMGLKHGIKGLQKLQ